MLTRDCIRAIAVLIIGFVPWAAHAQTVGVDWQSTTLTTATGDLDGDQIRVFGLFNGGTFVTADLSGPDFAAAPLSSSQEMLDYSFNSNWFVNFPSTMNEVLVFAKSWRGPNLLSDPPFFEYTFSQPFTILSGFAGATISGNTLQIPSDTFRDGILRFAGPFTSLSVTNNNANSASRQLMTFAVRPPPPLCPGDIADDFGSPTPDGMVGFGDFLALLGLVGPCDDGVPGCKGDIADDFGSPSPDGTVSFGDFLALLGLVGPCVE